MRVIIVTKPGMITPNDWSILEGVAEVDYCECNHVSSDELANLTKGYDCLMLNYDVVDPFDPTYYDRISGGRIKLISCDITGMSWAAPECAREHGILLCNTPNYCTESVAEHVFAETLLLSRRIHEAYLDFARNSSPQIRKGFDLYGKTLGVLGLGNIGTRVAEIASAFGMNVLAWNHRKKNSVFAEVPLEELLNSSDVVALCLKTVDETLGFMNKEKIELCKSGAIIVNQAGEQLINRDDMLDCIKNGVVAGYAGTLNADETHSLYKSEKVVALPPNAWYSDESLSKLRRIWVDNIYRFIVGEEINTIVS